MASLSTPRTFYDLFRHAQRALNITPLRDLYSAKDTYLSLALTNGVILTWLSEQIGVAVATILNHYGRFTHSSQTDDFELAKIENPVQFGHRFPETPQLAGMATSPTGFVSYCSRPFGYLPP